MPFLGKVSYPYGYQKPNMQVVIRVCTKSKNIEYDGIENLLAKTNSQVGMLKNYNCKKLIRTYANLLPAGVKNIIQFDENESKFYVKDKYRLKNVRKLR